MKNKQWLLSGLFLIAATLSANTNDVLCIYLTDGSVAPVPIESIRNMVVENGEALVIQQPDKNSRIELTLFKNMVFASTPTAIKPLGPVVSPNPLSVYPNPVGEVLHLRYTATGTLDVVIQVLDMNGKVLQGTHIPARNVTGETQLSVSTLPKGIYLCRIIDGNRLFSATFIKQ